ncbi:MAG: pantoate--beta-alanine ligase [Acidobacteria bacterium]|nr:MAG: pantoate--beta-alanine ligase [Acidobacteriota bacterium]
MTTYTVKNDGKKLQKLLQTLRADGARIGLVPTMGYLHEGHLSLIKTALQYQTKPVVSIFVNPTQFGPNEDLDTYPRNEERDIELATEAGAEIIWIPSTQEIYPGPDGIGSQQFKVVPGSISRKLCGSSRPVFFTGIATVVLKLFHIVKPDCAFFGEKDFQQLQIIKRMVREFHMGINIIGCPIIREEDGLAMSSRNVRIPASRRKKALHLYATIQKAKTLFQQGLEEPQTMLKQLKEDWPEGLELDYLELYDPETLEPADHLKRDTRLFLGAWLKTTENKHDMGVRLIDNAPLGSF